MPMIAPPKWNLMSSGALATAGNRLVDDVIHRGEGVYLYGKSGRTYLDFTSGLGVTNTGHCHPAVVEAVQLQAARLLFGQINGVVPETALELADALLPHLPAGLDRLFFANSGAEAVDAAITLARIATGRSKVIAMEGGSHGRTAMTRTHGNTDTAECDHDPQASAVFESPFPHGLQHRDTGVNLADEDALVAFCLEQLEVAIASQAGATETAAVLLEPVLSEGGYVPAPVSFLRGVRELCDRHGVLMIIDEIQSGCGRTGEWWCHTAAGLTPDILIMAKGIASGLPLALFAAPADLMAKLGPSMDGGTYGGGSAVAQAAAIATIEVIGQEDLLDNTRRQGKRLTKALNAIAVRQGAFREVRGPGLMIGCEFDAGPQGKVQADRIVKRCADDNLLLLTCGTHGNVVSWTPPLVVNAEQIDQGVTIFDRAVSEVLSS